ncbi:hypothetical protein KM043_014835 [Ampulex compressa]|nr:hypothetical protein KM043_014835 [Ampulex compressa]
MIVMTLYEEDEEEKRGKEREKRTRKRTLRILACQTGATSVSHVNSVRAPRKLLALSRDEDDVGATAEKVTRRAPLRRNPLTPYKFTTISKRVRFS